MRIRIGDVAFFMIRRGRGDDPIWNRREFRRPKSRLQIFTESLVFGEDSLSYFSTLLLHLSECDRERHFAIDFYLYKTVDITV
jgi:hypothetical protein